jgi:hypothetical protein
MESLPSHAIGLITENRKSTTFLETRTDIVDGTTAYREDVHSMINYGACLLLEPIRDWIDECFSEGRARRPQ